ncbi:transposase [Micromonospora coerulea]|uniref:transposase n=1 Tax=Micromonospora coerulea TaxID=47856 RepID=UPI003557DE99
MSHPRFHGVAVGRKSSVAGPKKCPDELRQRAVRLYRGSDPKPVIRRLAEQLGVHHEALRNWIRQAEADAGERPVVRAVEGEVAHGSQLGLDSAESLPVTPGSAPASLSA